MLPLGWLPITRNIPAKPAQSLTWCKSSGSGSCASVRFATPKSPRSASASLTLWFVWHASCDYHDYEKSGSSYHRYETVQFSSHNISLVFFFFILKAAYKIRNTDHNQKNQVFFSVVRFCISTFINDNFLWIIDILSGIISMDCKYVWTV